MAETIPGGAYLSADGKTWVNAAGKPIAAPKESELYKARDEALPLAPDEFSAPPEQEEPEAEAKPRGRGSRKSS